MRRTMPFLRSLVVATRWEFIDGRRRQRIGDLANRGQHILFRRRASHRAKPASRSGSCSAVHVSPGGDTISRRAGTLRRCDRDTWEGNRGATPSGRWGDRQDRCQVREYCRSQRSPGGGGLDQRRARVRPQVQSVYQVWITGSSKMKKRPGPGKVDAWKYGITKHSQGDRRRTDGKRSCERDSRTRRRSCRSKWVRQNIVGWARARVIEAMYASRYKAPGSPSDRYDPVSVGDRRGTRCPSMEAA